MAFSKSKLRRCPICAAHNEKRLAEIDLALVPLLDRSKREGEVPKLADKELTKMALELHLAPGSLRYHLKECLLGDEIKDQRLVELKDMIEAVQVAKETFMAEPTDKNGYSYTNMVKTFLDLATAVEGQQDPSLTVEFLVSTVMTPLTRNTLTMLGKELQGLRSTLTPLLSPTQYGVIDSQLKMALTRIGSGLNDVTNKALKDVCGYYKVELEAQTLKSALANGVERPLAEVKEQVAPDSRKKPAREPPVKAKAAATRVVDEPEDDDAEPIVH